MSNEMSPLEKFLLEKKAFDFGNLKTRLGDAAVGAGMTAAVGAGAAGIGLAASEIYNAVTKGRDFRSMLQSNPDLAEFHQQDPKGFNQMFSTLRNMNPAFSKDPLVAGTYMRRMLNEPAHAGMVAVEALTHRDRTPQPVFENFARGGLEGAKEMAKHQPFESGRKREMDYQHQLQLALQAAKQPSPRPGRRPRPEYDEE